MKIDTHKHQALTTHSLSEICNRGHHICKSFGAKIVSESKNLRLEAAKDCYNIFDESDRIIGKIVPRLVEDEIWYGVSEEFSGGPMDLEGRGIWIIDNTVYTFYNVDCEKYV